MRMWPIIKQTIKHCLGAVIICGAFWLAEHSIRAMFPNTTVGFYFEQIDFILVFIVMVILGLLFLNALIRLALDDIISSWKGPRNGTIQFLLA